MRLSLPSSRARDNLLFAFALAVAIAFPFIPFIADYSSRPIPRASGGSLDLRGWDFGREGAVRLSGEWLFIPGKLLDGDDAETGWTVRGVPDFWRGGDAAGTGGRGCGTYRLRILLPRDPGRLALRYTTVSTAFKAFADDKFLAQAGAPAAEASKAVPAYDPGVVQIPAAGDEIVLYVQVSNHEYRTGGLWRAFLLGPEKSLEMNKARRDWLTFLFVGILFGIALQGLFIYFFRSSAKTSLYFSVFAAMVALRALVTGEYVFTDVVPDISFSLLIRLEYITAYLIIPIAIRFLAEEFGFPGYRIFLAAHIPFLALIPWAPLPLLTRSITLYYPLALLMTLVALYTLVRAILKGVTGARPILIGCAVVASTGINDMLFSSFLVYTANLLPAGLVIFTVIMNLTTAYRYAKAYTTISDLLAEKETYLKEIHHRVKNSLQVAASMMTLQANRIGDKATASLFLTMRDRIRAIALVHEKLYSSVPGNRVDLDAYVRDLVAHLSSTYSQDAAGSEPELAVEGGPLEVPIDFCVDFGLALTELVINAYKHASGPASIVIAEKNGMVCAAVSDEGPGYPEGFDLQSGTSLGLKIVTSVVKRWNGELILSKGGNCGSVTEVRLRKPVRI